MEPAGENVLDGGGGDDLLDGRLGADVFEGGAGFDAVSYEGRSEAITASIDGAANDGSALDTNPANNGSDQIMGDVEDLIGGNGNDTLKGDDHSNILLGGPGDDLLQGTAAPTAVRRRGQRHRSRAARRATSWRAARTTTCCLEASATMPTTVATAPTRRTSRRDDAGQRDSQRRC